MSSLARRILRNLTVASAATSVEAEDPCLRGRTYGIPFETVWQAARSLAGGNLRRWKLVAEDDHEGLISAISRRRLGRKVHDVTIRITLDPDAQTRVDMVATARDRRGGFCSSRRRIRRFFGALDSTLGVR